MSTKLGSHDARGPSAERGQEPKPDLETLQPACVMCSTCRCRATSARTTLWQVHLRLAQRVCPRGQSAPGGAIANARELFGTVLAATGHAEDVEAGAAPARETHVLEASSIAYCFGQGAPRVNEGLLRLLDAWQRAQAGCHCWDGSSGAHADDPRAPRLKAAKHPATYTNETMQPSSAASLPERRRSAGAAETGHGCLLRDTCISSRHPREGTVGHTCTASPRSQQYSAPPSYVLLARYHPFSVEAPVVWPTRYQRGFEASGHRALDLSPRTAQAPLRCLGTLLLAQAEQVRPADRVGAAQPAIATIEIRCANPLLLRGSPARTRSW